MYYTIKTIIIVCSFYIGLIIQATLLMLSGLPTDHFEYWETVLFGAPVLALLQGVLYFLILYVLSRNEPKVFETRFLIPSAILLPILSHVSIKALAVNSYVIAVGIGLIIMIVYGMVYTLLLKRVNQR